MSGPELKARRRAFIIPAVLAALCAGAGLTTPGRAADFSEGAPAVFLGPSPDAGVPCSIGQPFWEPSNPTAAELPWASVWLGHFSGGRPYAGPFGERLVDWRDEKVCFSKKTLCQVWVGALRRAYHEPEGYWTCMLLR